MKKVLLTREQIEKAYLELTKCPCCGHEGLDSHACACSPEVFRNRKDEVEIEIYDEQLTF